MKDTKQVALGGVRKGVGLDPQVLESLIEVLKSKPLIWVQL